MFCQKCGAIDNGGLSCSRCGAKDFGVEKPELTEEQIAAVVPPAPVKAEDNSGCIVIFIVVIIALGIWMFG
jgi:hypothetical protein